MIELTRTGKNTLVVENPVLVASGIFGFDGAPYQDLLDLTKIGAMVTNPVTWKPRHVARGPRVVALPSGALVHTGLPNPGLRRVVQMYGERWKHSYVPIIVHIAATSTSDVARCATVLENCEGVAALELGLHDQSTRAEVPDMIRAALENTQLPLLVQLPLYSAQLLAKVAQDAGAGALVVAAAPRGTARDAETGRLVGGRVYGPWIKAQALRAVGQVVQSAAVPVIACGGIHSPDDARDFIEAGASAVQIDTLVWTQPHMLDVIARNLGGLELTRATGALADEWEPGMGQTMWLDRQKRWHNLPADDESGALSPPDHLPEE